MSERQSGELVGGRYRLMHPLAEGGMGALWVAEDLTLRRSVALKLLGQIELPAARQRFATEAMVIATLSCPHIVRIYDYAVDSFEAFIAMELLEGEDLAERFDRCGQMTLRETATLVWHTAMALAEVHDADIVHRDLKPGNVFLALQPDGGELIKLLDFGVAKLARNASSDGSGQTKVGSILGTPHYMSPEQARGLAYCADHRADLWALGVIAYQALTGQLPFDGNALPEILVNICTAPLTPVTTLVAGLPTALDAFFDKALARTPSERFADARQMAAAFLAIVREAEAPARPTTPAQLRDSCAPVVASTESISGAMVEALHAPPEPSRWRGAAVGVMLGSALLAGMAGGGWYTAADAAPAPAQTGLERAAAKRPAAPSFELSLPEARAPKVLWRPNPPYGVVPPALYDPLSSRR